MPQATNSYDQLIAKLDAFIRKYYLNSVIRGLLYTTGAVLLLFLLVSLLESQFYFRPMTRKLLWYGFLGLSLAAVGFWVVLPLTRYFRLGHRISHDQAAAIIGRHFTNVEDKLLNVLQLRRQAEHTGARTLVLAGIDQKAAEISPVPFRSAIDLSKNRRYLRYALPPLLLLLVLLVAAPSLITDSTDRLIRNSEEFERPAPFRFVVRQADDLEVVQYESFPLSVEIEGDAVPAEAFIEVDGYRYRLQRKPDGSYGYRFNNVQHDTPFRLTAAEVTSPEYTLDVLPKPGFTNFSVDIDYPDYLGRADERIENVGDLTVPVGSELRWSFGTENAENVEVSFAGEDTISTLRRDGSDLYSFDRRAMRSGGYALYASSDRLTRADSVAYGLSVIPDKYPQIEVERFVDSTDASLIFFAGEASDDYGLRRVDFVYLLRPEDGSDAEEVRIPVVPGTRGRAQRQLRYEHVLDMNRDIELAPGDELSYYFETFDNDGVNGSKSSKTATMVFRAPTREEMDERAESNDNKIKDELKKALDATRELEEDTEALRQKMLQESELDWKLQKEVEKLAERQEQIQQQIEEAKEAFEENRENQPPQDEQIQQKEEQLQEMFEEALDEEMQELMEEIQRLMEELNKDETLETIEQMELNDEQQEAQLDRMLELYKQLEVEKEMQDAMEKLEELTERQEELMEETGDEGTRDKKMGDQEKSDEELEKEQGELLEEMQKLSEQLERMQRKNEELSQPMPMESQEQESQEVERSMQEAQEQLQQQQRQEAAQQQKNAQKKMQQMQQQMQQQMNSMQQQRNQEDMDAIRQLLENIVDLSFDQEETMDALNGTTINTPRYVELVQEQFKINNDFELVQDSLQALARRNFQIESFITDKVSDIKTNLTGTVSELEERRTPQARNLQQRAMTGLNDLALMLSESMEQMQQQMAGQMAGQQQCQNPQQQGQGQGKPSSNPGGQPQGSEQQRSLGQDMEGVKEGMQKGKGGGSKEFAEMAARQAALRRALEEKQRQRQQGGEGMDPQLQELIDQMNANEVDLVNKRLTEETLTRQQDILNRMLDHERAEREQKMEERRESETAQQQRRELPPNLEEYLRERRAEVERFRRVTPRLKPYYRSLVDEYFRTLGGRP